MRILGIDVGSRTIKSVLFDSDRNLIVDHKELETTYHPVSQCATILDGLKPDKLIATGYGRTLVQDSFGADAVTEIKAHALGARRLFPTCHGVLDIGGQDTKAIALDQTGAVRKFEMNDRCAAGTGKFLEYMATSFRVAIERFGDYALEGDPGLVINSMCTVFAESEATSLMARGNRPEDIARALHLSVVRRSLSMVKRMSVGGPLVFSGGVARNSCIVELVSQEFKPGLLLPERPDLVGALGAALHGAASIEARP